MVHKDRFGTFYREDSKYRELFYGWDVVNEAVSDNTVLTAVMQKIQAGGQFTGVRNISVTHLCLQTGMRLQM